MKQAEKETKRLAEYLIENFQDEITEGSTAVDVAIKLLDELKDKRS